MKFLTELNLGNSKVLTEIDEVAIAEIAETIKFQLGMFGYDADAEILLKQVLTLSIKMYLNRDIRSDEIH